MTKFCALCGFGVWGRQRASAIPLRPPTPHPFPHRDGLNPRQQVPAFPPRAHPVTPPHRSPPAPASSPQPLTPPHNFPPPPPQERLDNPTRYRRVKREAAAQDGRAEAGTAEGQLAEGGRAGVGPRARDVGVDMGSVEAGGGDVEMGEDSVGMGGGRVETGEGRKGTRLGGMEAGGGSGEEAAEPRLKRAKMEGVGVGAAGAAGTADPPPSPTPATPAAVPSSYCPPTALAAFPFSPHLSSPSAARSPSAAPDTLLSPAATVALPSPAAAAPPTLSAAVAPSLAAPAPPASPTPAAAAAAPRIAREVPFPADVRWFSAVEKEVIVRCPKEEPRSKVRKGEGGGRLGFGVGEGLRGV